MTPWTERQRAALRQELAKPIDIFNSCRTVYREHAISLGSSNLAAGKVKPVTLHAFENWTIHNSHRKVAKLVGLTSLIEIFGLALFSLSWLAFGTHSLEPNEHCWRKHKYWCASVSNALNYSSERRLDPVCFKPQTQGKWHCLLPIAKNMNSVYLSIFWRGVGIKEPVNFNLAYLEIMFVCKNIHDSWHTFGG